MQSKLLEIIASGTLVLCATLAGAIVQSILQRRREVDKTIIELRMKCFAQLCTDMIPFLDAIGVERMRMEDEWTKDDRIVHWIFPLKKPKDEIEKMYEKVVISMSHAYLVASAGLRMYFDGTSNAASIIVDCIRQEPRATEIRTKADGVIMLSFWPTVMGDMRTELGIARPTNWKAAEKVTERM